MDLSQADFFATDSPRLRTILHAGVVVLVLPRGRESSVPRNSGFNKLLARVENLGRQLQDLQQLADVAPPFGADGGAKAQDGRARREMLVFLHQRLQRKGLTAAQQKAMRQKFCPFAC